MCQFYSLLFGYQSQSTLNVELQTALEIVCPSLLALIFRGWMHTVVVLFVWEKSSTVSSRGSRLCIVLPRMLRSCWVHFKECVRVCGLCDSCPAVAEDMAAIWFAGITFKSTFFFSFWVRALGCSYLPPRRLMLLSFLWMNWVLAISIFCIWKAYCILDRSFSLP